MPTWGPVVGVALPLAVLAVVFTTIGLVRTRRVRRWVPTTGEVLATSPLEVPGLPTRFPTFTWQDASGGRHQRTARVRPGPPPGTVVPVRYDPADPSRAMIDGFVQGGRLFLGIGLALAVLTVVVAATTLAITLAGRSS